MNADTLIGKVSINLCVILATTSYIFSLIISAPFSDPMVHGKQHLPRTFDPLSRVSLIFADVFINVIISSHKVFDTTLSSTQM